jgi:hypothetical protein
MAHLHVAREHRVGGRENRAEQHGRAQCQPEHVVAERGVDVDVSADEPVFGDGASFNVAVGALPLEDGYVTTLHRLDLMQGEAAATRIEVTGTESVIVPGGTFDAWVIEVAPPDGEPSKLWIDRDSRRVVRAELRLGAQMGGGTAIMELTGGV